MKTDIYKFINSKSVADYLKKIEYEFSGIESAYIVWQSMRTTLQEKFAAWEDIIASTPDVAVEARRRFEYQPSLHAFLRKYIELTKQKLQEFYSCDNAVYSYEVLFKEDSVWSSCNGQRFTTFDFCKQALLKVIEDDEISCYYVSKQTLNSDRSVDVFFNANHEECGIRINFSTDNEEEYRFFNSFNGLWFQIPTPFKSGDIVYLNNQWVSCGEQKTPFVLTDMVSWGENDMRENGYTKPLQIEQNLKVLEYIKQNGDSSDMLARGFFVSKFGEIYVDHTVLGTYLEMDYYDEELTRYESVLKDISNFIKGKINRDDVIKCYELVLHGRQTEFVDQLKNSLVCELNR